MPELPSRQRQIVQAHAALIVNVVKACHNPEIVSELEPVLQAAESMGQQDLAAVIRRILNGARDVSLTKGLDDDDMVIVEAILRGLQDPASLPDPDARPDPAVAAPGFAYMIHEAARGNAQAMQMLANMAEQMMTVGGDMARLGGIMRRLIDGERDADKLSARMDARGQSLVLSILEELAKLDTH